MSISSPPSQPWLSQALDRVYGLVHGDSAAPAISPEQSEDTLLSHLRRMFGLTSFESDLLILLLGNELESRFAQANRAESGDRPWSWPTLGLALHKLPDPHWSAISNERPLRYWMLVEMGPEQGMLNRALRLDERIVHYLMGIPGIDARLAVLLSPLSPPQSVTSEQAAPAELAARYWSGEIVPARGRKPLLLVGRAASEQQALLHSICQKLDLHPAGLMIGDLPTAAVEREQLARLCNREALLSGTVLYLRGDASDSPESARQAAAFLSRIHVPCAVEVAEGSALEQLDGFRIEVPSLGYGDRTALWKKNLEPVAERLNGQIERIAENFRFTEPTIAATSALICDAIGRGAGEETAWRICRQQCRHAMEHLAKRIESSSSPEDLILPASQREMLIQMVSQARHRGTVDNDWGFARRCGRGLGMAALFAGASGTGKTMAAEILAAQLDRDLFQIDLASVVSKYIGETEKNLRRIFDAAEQGAAVLLFDEADALFGKRSEVRDSHDRYANLEISYLLQRMESYSGIAILTTNMERSMDEAFMRRLRFIVHFPFPDAPARKAIWERMFPPQTPLGELDFGRLAQLKVAGGTIRNIAVQGAFLAAEQRSPVGMPQLLMAAKLEYSKLGRPLTTAEIGGWA